MRVIERVQHQIRTGQQSDGSDAQLVTVMNLRVIDNNGIERRVQMPANYTDQDVIDAVRSPAELVPTRKADIEDAMDAAYQRWQRWKNTRLEAEARSMSALVITALKNREDALWGDYVAAIQVWRNAT